METLPPVSDIQKHRPGMLRRILAAVAVLIGLLLAGIAAQRYQEWQNSHSTSDSFKVISE